jgi:transposase
VCRIRHRLVLKAYLLLPYNRRLAREAADVGWAQFLTFLQRKAAAAGRKVVAVNPANTSQLCSGCGQIVPKKLSDRWHLCPHCGTSLDRDHNAAINILRLAGQFPLFRAGQALQALSRSLSDLPENPLALAMGSVKTTFYN